MDLRVPVTGLPADHPDVIKAISNGAFAHLTKPVRHADVRSVLAQMESENGRMGRIR